MNKIIINDKTIEFDGDKTILDLARENGFDIPVLCELKNCGNKGQCGVCLVEQEGNDRLLRSCAIKAKDGMVIKTDSEKVLEARKERVAELLDEHEFKCGPCKRRENCEFLKLVIKTKARAHKPFVVADKSEYVDDRSKSIVLDRSKCVKCGRCVAACRTRTATNSIKFHRIDGVRLVGPEELKCFDDTNCLLCGQCIAACPVDALSEKSHIERVQDALNDPEKHVIVAMAPAVRTSMGELFKMGYGQDVTGKLYTALRELGFDKVFDINFGADMTIMEEATELIERIKNNGPFPMLTSCCPSWVREVENYFPELVENLSTAKSPQQIFGAASKTYYPQVADIDPKKVFTVTVMPCTSKKFEADRPEMENEGIRNIDAVITTRELARMIKAAKIDFAKLEDGEVDPAMGEYTGAGVIFGATGGVMEAALRTAKDFMENDNLDNVDYEAVRGLAGIKEAEVEIAGNEYKLAVVSGAANVFELVKSGKINDYHFIEVMACPGGCIGGGGQPRTKLPQAVKTKEARIGGLYKADEEYKYVASYENPEIQDLYKNFLGEPLGHKAHELLHTHYTDRSAQLGDRKDVVPETCPTSPKYKG